MKKVLYVALAAALFVGCSDKGEEERLSLSEREVILPAAGGEVKTVTVDATTTWAFTKPSDASWFNVTKPDDRTLAFSATDENATGAELTATVIVTAGSKKDQISVRQLALETPEFAVDRQKVEFVGKPDGPETVKVTISGGLTFRTEIDKTWFKAKADVEAGTITVTCNNNTSDSERNGTIKVIPSDKKLEPIIIDVHQAGLVIERHIWVVRQEGDEEPLTQLDVDYKGLAIGQYVLVDRYPYDLDWTAEVVAKNEGEDASWLIISVDKVNGLVLVRTRENAEATSREAYVRFSATDASLGVEPFDLLVKQAAKPDYLSTLTGNIDETVTDGTSGNSGLSCYFNAREIPISEWSFGLCTNGVTYGKDPSNPLSTKWLGTGSRVMVTLQVTKYKKMSDVYLIPEGDYVITSEEGYKEFTAPAGVESGDPNLSYVNTLWYAEMEDGAVVNSAPLVSGTINVKYSGEGYVYTFTVDAEDDNHHSIKFTWTGNLEPVNVNTGLY